ncbi:ABC transporter ATP-binding protein [Herbiconiux sp. KACC 21604]|nr:ABC transporter ATP-binding protein [Herbiconiux sp. SALV-R1]WPO88674.1 ABC transporter ATP-binding protein [Herbiconiux sp. KACC 21604]
MRASSWGWRHAGREAWALRRVDLVVEPGERVLLLGASGAGKSTLMHAFAGVLGGADEGEEEGALEVGDTDARHARGRVGLLLQDPDSQLVLARVGDDVAFGCENLGVPREEIWPRVERALDSVGLGDLALDHSTSALSGGQKQRVALAGVMAMLPGVVLLDEPTANLDPEGVVEVRDAVGRVVEQTGATLVVIEHRVDVWLDVVDRVVVLEPGGGVIADGTPQRVLRDRGAELARDGVWVPGIDPLGGRRARRGAAGTAVAEVAAGRGVTASGAGVGTAADGAAGASEAEAVAAKAGAGVADGAELLATRGLAVTRAPEAPVAAVDDTVVAAARAVAVTGRNGAGKSTFALTLSGLLLPAAGEVRASELLRGVDGDLPAVDARPARRIRSLLGRRRRASVPGVHPGDWGSKEVLTRIGVVFQDPEHQFVTGSVRAELEVSLRALGLSEGEIAERVTEVASRLRLDRLLSANPYTLSGGEKRRLSVASALVARPAVLVLDEPTFGQDSRTWAELVLLLGAQLDRGTALVAVTHDRAFVEALADHELVIG